jgi:hypothetical protein
MNHLGERAEFADQHFGERLDVGARLRAEQHHLQQLVVAQCARPSAMEAVAQPHPMAVIMRRVVAGLIAGIGRHWR